VTPPMRADDPYLHDYFRRFRWTADPSGTDRRVLFLVGSTAISGGTYVILQHALWLADHGWDVHVAAISHHQGEMAWHPALERLDIRSIDEVDGESFDVAIATWWPTVYELPRVRARHHLYLVQSVEARFFGEDPGGHWAEPLAELTYTFGLPIVTIASWLQVYLALRHGAPSFLVRNGIRKDIYNPVGPAAARRESGRLRVLVEGPVGIPMKNVDAALRLARAGGADEVWLMAGALHGAPVGADRVFERVPIESTPVVYRSCDVLLKLSRVEGMFGPPLEMFHCGGTAVSYDVTGYEEYLEHGVNGLVVPMDDEDGVVEAIRSLKADPDLLARLRTNALETASRWPDWERSSAEFGRFLSAVIRQPAVDRTQTMLAIRGAQRDFP
jgi:glycosyltransferase involved in cell wall biosynthesis